MDPRRVGPHVESEDRGTPCRGLQEPEQGPDGGRLTGAVRPEEAEYLAFVYGKGDVRDAPPAPVRLGKGRGFDDARHPPVLICRAPRTSVADSSLARTG
jgi:hypothetical protein